MSDFYQSGAITTLHILGSRGYGRIEEELNEISKEVKTTLIIPALYSDFILPPMKNILEILDTISYLNRIIISIGRASKEEFELVKKAVAGHSDKIILLWMDNPDILNHFMELSKNGMKLGEQGKGLSCWTSFGLNLALGNSNVVALHDSDIITYSREMLARLLYPVMNPNFSYEFSKGYYARFSNKLHGRATRLLLNPLLKAINNVMGEHVFIDYLKSFRYPLAGEFALKTSLTRVIRFPADWGLEVSTLYEIYRNVALKRICQVELTQRYDHKHQKLSSEDSSQGLHKMAIDISTNIFKNLAAEGIIVSEGVLETIQKNYRKISEDIISNYHADAMINGLEFHRHHEENIVETFYRALVGSSYSYLTDPMSYMMLPNWNRITSAYPDFLSTFRELVEKDNQFR